MMNTLIFSAVLGEVKIENERKKKENNHDIHSTQHTLYSFDGCVKETML